MERYYIYKFTNKINNMIYIGQSLRPEKRLKEHLYGRKKGNDTYFDKSIKKYGIENFTFEIIDSSEDRKIIDELEKKYIIKYNSLTPNGYNILKGGRNQQGSWNSKKIKEYDLNGNYINAYESAGYYENFVNKEYKQSGITRSCRENKHYKNRIFRYYDFKGKVEKYKEPLPNHIKKIYQFDYNGNLIKEHISITNASRKTNTSRTSILGCASGIYKTGNGFLWSYNNKINIDDLSPKHSKKTIIYKCDKDKKIIKKYFNTREAEIDNNFKYNSYKTILRYLDTNKMYNGFYWYRVKTYEDNIVPSLNEN